jgi:membrane-associated phospholipid phosphatase
LSTACAVSVVISCDTAFAQTRSIGESLGAVAGDPRSIWTFPIKAVRGERWTTTLPIAAAAAALIVLDEHDTAYFRRTNDFRGLNRSLSGLNTGLAEGLIPLGFFLTGWAADDSYAMETGLLAGEALLDTVAVVELSKNLTRRLRPSDIAPSGDFGRSWFKIGEPIWTTRGSFPSGHTAGAFAVAAVFSKRYREHRWVPWVAYGAAGLVAFSRVTLQSHFPSDVFVGASLGGAVGHLVGSRHSLTRR